jgi:hypothetical protein
MEGELEYEIPIPIGIISSGRGIAFYDPHRDFLSPFFIALCTPRILRILPTSLLPNIRYNL